MQVNNGVRGMRSGVPGPKLPIYHQIAQILRGRIYHEVYAHGQAIPSESELSHEFGVSRLTVRQAVRELATEGMLVARRGSGTFVAESAELLRPVNFAGSLDDLILQIDVMEAQITRIAEIQGPPAVRRALQVPRGEPLVVVDATRLSRGEVANHSVNYLPASIGRRLPVDQLRQHSIVYVMRDELGIAVTSATQSLTALAAPPGMAQRLGVAAGAPVLFSEFVMLASDRPVLASQVYYRPDRGFFTATLAGPLAWSRSGAPVSKRRRPRERVKAVAAARRHRAARRES